ncbi:hypothetical protein GQ43DRAFT_159617 [Delitschia confertaspora ATCC 74209]|uniref:Uncharacterized protein n=1 Tax=Delitschia confertaspora ATCC 74209 TaxID=1513339 RepID=A0A9P4K0J1_9PLEO|nr:hypothetical protein GQ43DRAFT_159617 [Delitschia confertaspora ATCC 74209]
MRFVHSPQGGSCRHTFSFILCILHTRAARLPTVFLLGAVKSYISTSSGRRCWNMENGSGLAVMVGRYSIASEGRGN